MTSAIGSQLTIQQRSLSCAIEHVSEAEAALNKEGARIYGGLCHRVPMLIRACGLCQTLAFVEDKAGSSGPRADAYTLLRRHIAQVLAQDESALLVKVRDAPVVEYMRLTRTLLRAWVYHKRFAVSILKVLSAQAADEEETDGDRSA